MSENCSSVCPMSVSWTSSSIAVTAFARQLWASGSSGKTSAAVASISAVLGPAPLFRLKGRERSQLVVKGVDRAASVAAVRAAVEGVVAEHGRRGVSFSVDVDPQ